ncbi:myosin-2 heavy chain [Nilaparvata lugens]|uniref:myosin-2 heavy chain n=1 Tax=Nilaparvata lugens TaxID=108931 RepID=UPI00193D17DD|nr:myosin-2 heavy chain [Nilaparvata lugens]
MQHIRPTGKGDPLCPLGFHPQVRWPTRCKRCFRDYKEHGNRNKEVEPLRRDEVTASSPSLSSWNSRLQSDSKKDSGIGSRSWTSSTNLADSSSATSSLTFQKTSSPSSTSSSSSPGFSNAASSWTSTPNLADMKEDAQPVTTVNVTLPRRRPQPVVTDDDGGTGVAESENQQDTPTPRSRNDYRRTQYTVRRRTSTPSTVVDTSTSYTPKTSVSASATITTTFSRASRTPDRVVDKTPERTPERVVVKLPEKPVAAKTTTEKSSKADMDFMMQVKSSKPPRPPTSSAKKSLQLPPSKPAASSSEEDDDDDDNSSTTGTETTETTLVNDTSELQNLKLQQKVNELNTTLEDLKDDKRSLSLRVKELEADLEKSKSSADLEKEAETLRAKLQAAETLCEELMDENEDMKKELRDLEEEMDEMQDNFREEQADEYSSLKKELEQTAKNCRILSFKLRKAERKLETVEAEKIELEKKCKELAGGSSGQDKVERIRHLEKELTVANEVAQRLQKELEEAKEKMKSINDKDDGKTKKKAPMLGSIPKTPSGEKVSRESLTRGGSQEDPVQLLRDLQDSMEREADLREQLRFAEEEAENLRKKASRVEDDNESLVLQLKKMATKARTQRHSPSSIRLTPESPQEKDEGISDEEDPAELRLLLELNEQEAAVLRRKVEELEGEGTSLRNKVKDLQEKLAAKTSLASRRQLSTSDPKKGEKGESAVYEKKIKILEEEMNELRKKLLEKERDCERLHTEITLAQKKPKTLVKSKSLDASSEALDLKRQLQVVEQEASVLRTRTQSLESDNEKLVAENKRMLLTRGTKKASASASDSSALLQLKEKVTALEKQLEDSNAKLKEHENEQLEMIKKEVKDPAVPSSAELDKMKKLLTKAENEKSRLTETLTRMKEAELTDIEKFYQKRTPKKPTDLTTKLQLKRMVEDLENEIGEVLVALKKSTENNNKTLAKTEGLESNKLKTEIEELNKKLEAAQKCMKQEKEVALKEIEKLKKEISTQEDDKKKLDKEKEKLKNLLEEEKKKLSAEKQNVDKMKSEIGSSKSTQEESTKLKKQVDKLTAELQEENNKAKQLNKQIEDFQKADQDRSKLIKDIGDKAKKINEMDKKMKELEEKLKKSERLVSTKKDKITKLEKEVGEYKEKIQDVEAGSSGELKTLQKEKSILIDRVTELQAETDYLSSQLSAKKSDILRLEENLKEEQEKLTDLNSKAGNQSSQELSKLKDELNATKKQAKELNDTIKKLEAEKSKGDETSKELKDKYQKEITEWEKKSSDLEMDLQAERKMIERLKATHEKEIKNKESELTTLKSKSALTGSKKLNEVRQELQAKIDRLELALSSEKHEYDELTSKYEQLEEEHVVTKAQLVREREVIQGQLVKSQRELSEVEVELKTLRETYNTKQDTWTKEKLEMQEKLRENVSKAEQDNTWQLEKMRLTAMCEEKASEVDSLRRENMTQVEQIECMRKEADEIKRKLDDYEKVVKLQRSYSTDTSNIDRELRETKNKLFLEEKARKSEVASLKLSYDNRVSVISDELKKAQTQVSRFKKERDNFRHMLESAQKSISELKAAGTAASSGSTSPVEGEELQSQIATLEQQINCMEDELSESRLEASRLKTELVSERSAWEVKLSEMNSKINELEEERLMASGRTKISGLKTRMELAWHKEREDQQRLLQEASTLARDLRQTLFEVERERDKERLEAKRKLEQMKRSGEEEQEETRKKLNELHCDLLELRDAHAKLRTTNEKLRREKDRSEKEKDLIRQATSSRMRQDQEDDRRVIDLLNLVEDLMRQAPELFPSAKSTTGSTVNLTTPTPPIRRKDEGPKSRESSPAIDREPSVDKDSKSQQIQSTMKKLSEAVEELRRTQKTSDERRRVVQARKSFGSRRAASSESENPPEALLGNGSRTSSLQRKGSLYRKSLSLEQTTAVEQGIWKGDGNETEGSFNSIASLDDAYDAKFFRRDASLDSRLSGGSTQSEVITSGTEKKKKKGLLGKLKKLTKSSRSIDHDGGDMSSVGSTGQIDLGSDSALSSATEPERVSKRDLKDRLTGIFKKSGSASRGNSLERNTKPPTGSTSTSSGSTLAVSGSSRQGQERASSISRATSSSALTRASPARSDSSMTSSSTSRPLISSSASTPGSAQVQRKVVKK